MPVSGTLKVNDEVTVTWEASLSRTTVDPEVPSIIHDVYSCRVERADTGEVREFERQVRRGDGPEMLAIKVMLGIVWRNADVARKSY